MPHFVLDAATMAAFQRAGHFDALRAAAAGSFEMVDVVYQELTEGTAPYDTPIRDAVQDGWLAVRDLPAAFAPCVRALLRDGRLGFKLHEGEAASIAYCTGDAGRVLVSPDKAAVLSAFKHLHGTTAPRALSLYGFVRWLVDEGRMPVAAVRPVIGYACRNSALRPIWWDTWSADARAS